MQALNTKTKKISKISAKIILAFCAVFFLFQLPLQAIEFKLDPTYNNEILQLNQQINDKRKSINALNKQAAAYQKNLQSKRNQLATLNYQISTIDQTMTKLSLEKESLELQIEEMNLSIKNNQLKIQATEEQVAGQKEKMAAMIRELYFADQKTNLIAILATNSTLSDYLTNLQSLENLQAQLDHGLKNLNTLSVALVGERQQLDQNKKDALTTQVALDAKQSELEEQRVVKFSLIDTTRGEEGKYQKLLQDLKDEQSRINNDIVNLEQVAREKLNRSIQQGKQLQLQSGPMAWPISSHLITSYFHDPDYPFRNVFEHPAIDIATAQGTPIKAVASGYVARAKNGGLGYSYIMLVHDDDLATVYGHVSAINVAEGTFVTQGQIIGLSGGQPKTAGAGPLTTGAHLHFEVRLNGIPVNPLNYLPQ